MSTIAELSPDELIRRCVDGSSDEAWNEFLRRYRASVASAIFQSAQSLFKVGPLDVEDLVQTVIKALLLDDCKLLRGMTFLNDHALRGYLRKIASHIALDAVREKHADKRGGNAPHVSVEQDPSLAVPVSGQTAHEMIDQVLLSRIEEFLGTYPARERTVFWLHHRQGYTTPEIARIKHLGITKTQVDSILRKLERNVEKYFGGSETRKPAEIRLGRGGTS